MSLACGGGCSAACSACGPCGGGCSPGCSSCGSCGRGCADGCRAPGGSGGDDGGGGGGCSGCTGTCIGCTSCTDTCTGCSGGCSSCTSCTGTCTGCSGCTGCTGSCSGRCDNACSSSSDNSAINSTRSYDIVYADDYNHIINILKKDMARRGVSYTGTAQVYGNGVNEASTAIGSIINNARKIGYSTSESYDVVMSSQLQRLERFVKSKAKEKLVR